MRESKFNDKKQQYLRSLTQKQGRNPLENHYNFGSNADPGITGRQISPEEGQLIYTILKIHSNIERVVEIGTLLGYSTSWIASALPDKGVVYTIERHKGRAKAAREKLSSFGDKIKVVEGEALDQLKQLSSLGWFDAVFIDAKKSEYCLYLDWAENNIKKGGLIIADNVLLSDKVFLTHTHYHNNTGVETMLNFNARLSDPLKYESSLITTQEGLFVARKLF